MQFHPFCFYTSLTVDDRVQLAGRELAGEARGERAWASVRLRLVKRMRTCSRPRQLIVTRL